MKDDLIERLQHCSDNADDEYLRELAGRAAAQGTADNARIAALEAVAGYAWHGPSCMFGITTCDCGFAEAQDLLERTDDAAE